MRWSVIAVALALACCSVLDRPSSAWAEADPRCAGPDALRDADEVAAAKRAYARLLLAQPKLACASQALMKLNESKEAAASDAKKLCALGAAYRRVHRNDDALKQYKSAVAKDPSPDSCGERGLNGLHATWGARLDRVVAALPNVLAAAGIGVICGMLLLVLGHLRGVSRVYRRLPIVRTILKPRLMLADLDERDGEAFKAGTAVTARIRERLARFRQEALEETAFADNLDFGTSSQDLADIVSRDGGLESSLDKFDDVGGHTKVVAAVIAVLVRLLPIKRLAFSGIIEPVSGPAASVTLSMQMGPRLAGAVTLTGRDLDHEPAAGDYLALAAPAAVWVQYEVARALADEDLPSEKAESYALVREGLDYYDAGDPNEAVRVFTEALALDPGNWAAKVNLALTQARLAKDADRAEEILRQALRDFEDEHR